MELTPEDKAEIARIEEERRRREEALLLLLLLFAGRARRLAASAILTGHDSLSVIRSVILGNSAIHQPGLVGALTNALVETYVGGRATAFRQAAVAVPADFPVYTVGLARFQPVAQITAENAATAMAGVAIRAIDDARRAGKTTPQIAQALRDAFTRYGWTRFSPQSIDPRSKGSPGYAAASIATGSILNAWADGHWTGLWHPSVAPKITAFTHRTVMDGRETDICHERDGLTLAPSDPYWLLNWPSLHYNCRSIILPRLVPVEFSETYPIIPPMPGFGQSPDVAFGARVGRAA